MTTQSSSQDGLKWGVALGAALMCSLTGMGAWAQEPSPLAGTASPREGYARDVVVGESFRFMPGGRALPVTGDTAALVSRLNAAGTAALDLGVTLIPGLEMGEGQTLRLFEAPPALRADGTPAAALAAKLVTLHPIAYHGVPLAPGSDVFSVATITGKLLAVRERNLPRDVDGAQPTVGRDAAARVALETARSHAMPADAGAAEPALEVFVDASAQGRLAWRVRVASASLTEPWARDIWLAAIGDPSVLADREGIFHAHHGNVAATAWSDSPFGASPSQGLAAASVTRNGSSADKTVTNANGNYSFPFGSGTATLTVGVAGPHSVVNNVAGAEVEASGVGSPFVPINLSINATGDAELAQTSAFVWVNRAHALVGPFLPANALAALPTNVNIAQSCNAFWNGSSVNFFQAGGSCPNTAYADVVMHEYGHGVDQAMGGILDGGYSEGFGDAMSQIGTRQSCVGRDFFGAGTCLREATDVILWPADTTEVHAVGRRYAGFVSALINELQRDFSPNDAFEITRQLVLGAAAANPANIPDAVLLSFVVDDDDGDLSNGTPHCTELGVAADSRHIPHPFCSPAHVRTMADINNDGRADIVGFGDAGVWTSLATGDGGFALETFVLADFGSHQGWNPAKHVRTMADLNNDGRADIVAFGDAGVWTALSNGDGTFAPHRFVLADFGSEQAWDAAKHVRMMADLNHDGREDIVAFGDAGVWTALSNGDGTFAPHRFVLADFGSDQGWTPSKHVRTMADLNHDGQADIVAFGDAGVWTALSNGDGTFAPHRFVLADFGSDQGWTPSKHVRTMADLNNDGKADIVAFGDAGVWTALSAGDGSFEPHRFVLADFGSDHGWDPARHVRTMADLDNDGRRDIVAFGNAGVWTALSAGDGTFAPHRFVLADFGSDQGWDPTQHVRTTADVSKDGKADIVAFGFAGVWTAVSTGDGAFAPHRFVLANFGATQGWGGGTE